MQTFRFGLRKRMERPSFLFWRLFELGCSSSKNRPSLPTSSALSPFPGCIISIFSYDGTSLLSPIYEWLGTPGTVLRTSEDASMLLHALLDVTVDETMTIAEAFRAELDVLEGRALIKPDTAGVRNRELLPSSSPRVCDQGLTRLLPPPVLECRTDELQVRAFCRLALFLPSADRLSSRLISSVFPDVSLPKIQSRDSDPS